MKGVFLIFILVCFIKSFGQNKSDSVINVLKASSKRTNENKFCGKWQWIDCRDTMVVQINPVETFWEGRKIGNSLGWLRYVENRILVVDNLESVDSSFNKLAMNMGISGDSAGFFFSFVEKGCSWKVEAKLNKNGKKMEWNMFLMELSPFILDNKEILLRTYGKSLPSKLEFKKIN